MSNIKRQLTGECKFTSCMITRTSSAGITLQDGVDDEHNMFSHKKLLSQLKAATFSFWSDTDCACYILNQVCGLVTLVFYSFVFLSTDGKLWVKFSCERTW